MVETHRSRGGKPHGHAANACHHHRRPGIALRAQGVGRVRAEGVPYQVDPIHPFFGGEQFSALNPLRRIPVFIDDKVSISDSTVICEYLEERYPAPPLLPSDLAQRAQPDGWRSCDTRIGDVFIWRIFYEAVINPHVWQKPRDKALIARLVAEELPEVMDCLERAGAG